MTKSELLKELEGVKDDDELEFYVWDYEYDDEEPYEVGTGKFTSIELGMDTTYLNIGVHKE